MRKPLIYAVVFSLICMETTLFAQFPENYPTYNQATYQDPVVVAPRMVTPSAVQTYHQPTINQNFVQGHAAILPNTTSPNQVPFYQQQQVSPQYQTSLNPQQNVYQNNVPVQPQQQQAYYQTIPQNHQLQYPVAHQQQTVNHVAALSHQPNMSPTARDSIYPTYSPDHPLAPVILWARRERPRVAQIKDYTAILRKQENINGRLQDGNIMEVKIRHEPFSVYMKFVAPKPVDGQEVLYIAGENNGQMWAHGVGLYKIAGTRSMDPLHPIAMTGCRYPLTYVGILNLVDKLLEVGEHDAQFGNCKVHYYENVKLGNREYLCIEVIHPERHDRFRFHLARIYVDNEYNLPVRYESYDWPKAAGQKPELLEAYSYDNLKINVGLKDEDFSILNRNYNF